MLHYPLKEKHTKETNKTKAEKNKSSPFPLQTEKINTKLRVGSVFSMACIIASVLNKLARKTLINSKIEMSVEKKKTKKQLH